MDRARYMRPSGAGSWSACVGYAALNASLDTEYVEEPDNEVREDGTAWHWLAEQVWNGSRPSVGSLSPNGREITEEMYVGVEEYHEMLRAWGVPVRLEQKVPVATHFPGVADGTADAVGIDHAALLLNIGDGKYGYRIVDPWRNKQLTCYAWTVVCELAKQGVHIQTIRFWICQPRAAHPEGTTRMWRVSVRELAELAAWLAARALEAYSPDPQCTAGPQCWTCAGAYACRTAQAAGFGAMDVSYSATPFVLNEGQLGYELARMRAARDRLDNRINGLETQAETLIRRGKRVPGFDLGRRATRWRWKSGAEGVVRRLGEMFGVPVVEEPKLRSVAKLRNAFPFDVQSMYAEKPVGELVLKAVDPNEAIRKMGRTTRSNET